MARSKALRELIGTQWDPVPAVLTAVAVGTWYAVPDFYSSRKSRALAKTLALVPASIAAWSWSKNVDQNSAEVRGTECDLEELTSVLAERPGTSLAIGTGVAAGVTTAVVVGEKVAYQVAEHMKSRGVSRAHTKNGLIYAALAAAGMFVSGPGIVKSKEFIR